MPVYNKLIPVGTKISFFGPNFPFDYHKTEAEGGLVIVDYIDIIGPQPKPANDPTWDKLKNYLRIREEMENDKAKA